MKESYWRNQEYWICPNHIPSIRIPAIGESCWYTSCSKRPSARLRILAELPPVLVELPDLGKKLCNWRDCNKNNGDPAISRGRSKYCSVDCKNRNARWRYRLRKKGMPIPLDIVR